VPTLVAVRTRLDDPVMKIFHDKMSVRVADGRLKLLLRDAPLRVG
jgi:hypothetical protein